MLGTRRGREFWTRLVDEFEAREPRLRHVAYAAEKGVRVWTFRSWLYRLRRERRESRGGDPSFLPVELIGDGDEALAAETVAVAGSPIDAALPNGVLLRFAVGTDPEYVGALLRAVSGGPR